MSPEIEAKWVFFGIVPYVCGSRCVLFFFVFNGTFSCSNSCHVPLFLFFA